MEEITTRFEIVRLAVKMADHETITVQARKLRDLSLDEDLNEIISLLESRNYRQGLFLMKGYVNSLDDSFFNDTPPTRTAKKPKTKETPQETQNLFNMMQTPAESKTINLDDMLRMTEESAEETVGYDEPEFVPETYVTQAKEEVQKNEAFLNIHKNRVENKTVKPFEEEESEIQDEINETVVEVPHDPLEKQAEPVAPEEDLGETPIDKEVPEETDEHEQSDQQIPEVAIEEVSLQDVDLQEPLPTKKFIDIHTNEISIIQKDQPHTAESEQLERESRDSTEEISETVPEDLSSMVKSAVTKVDIPSHTMEDDSEDKTLALKSRADYTKENRRYPPISYIDQKFRNMRHQFPQVEESDHGIIDEVKILLKQVSTKGYTDTDIKEAIVFFQQKKAEGQLAEAAQMLLLAAASESKYAQLLLARELFKGEVLKADYPESFTQINRLAEHEYPEAICDLAQLYEYGYGIKKDKKTALLLYEEAAEMGVERAQKHVERLSSKSGILGLFLKG